MTNAIGYIRVSRVNGRSGENYISPDYQRDEIKRIADRDGLRLVAILQDEDASGGTNNRPGLQEALQRIEEGEAKVIVVAYQSRFARTARWTYESMGRLEDVGARLVAGDVNGGDKLLRLMNIGMAEKELDRITEQWADANARFVARGGYPGHTAPLGYRFGEGKRLVVDDEVAPAVRLIFEGRGNGRSWSFIADRFEEATGRKLHPGSLKNITRNRAYLGESRRGEFTNATAHEPLVPLIVWEAAQSTKPRPARSANGSLLGGVLRCDSCGRPMSYRGDLTGQYTCNRFAGGEKCPAPVLIKAELIDSYVEKRFQDRYFGAPAVEGVSTQETDVAVAEAELDRATSDLGHLLGLDLAGLGDMDEFKAAVTEKQAAKRAAEDRLRELRRARNLRDQEILLDEEAWAAASIEQRRSALAQAITSLRVHRVGPGQRVPIEDRVELEWYDDEPVASAETDRAAA